MRAIFIIVMGLLTSCGMENPESTLNVKNNRASIETVNEGKYLGKEIGLNEDCVVHSVNELEQADLENAYLLTESGHSACEDGFGLFAQLGALADAVIVGAIKGTATVIKAAANTGAKVLGKVAGVAGSIAKASVAVVGEAVGGVVKSFVQGFNAGVNKFQLTLKVVGTAGAQISTLPESNNKIRLQKCYVLATVCMTDLCSEETKIAANDAIDNALEPIVEDDDSSDSDDEAISDAIEEFADTDELTESDIAQIILELNSM